MVFLGTVLHGCPYKSDYVGIFWWSSQIVLQESVPKKIKKTSIPCIAFLNLTAYPLKFSMVVQDNPFLIWDGQVADGQGLEQDRFVKIHEFCTTWSSSSLCCYLAAKIYCLKLFGVEGMLELFGGVRIVWFDICVCFFEGESGEKNRKSKTTQFRGPRIVMARWHLQKKDEKSGVNINGKGIENNCWGMPDF